MTISESPLGAQEAGKLIADMVVAEYNFVEGLIPFYRRTETTALAAAISIVAAVIGGVAALEAQGSTDVHHTAEATLLSLGTWLIFATMLIQTMSMMRIRRASAWIKNQIHPFVVQMTSVSELPCWEKGHTPNLLESLSRKSERVTRFFLTSQPVIFAMALPVVICAGLAFYVHPDHFASGVPWAGFVGACASVWLAVWSSKFSWLHEAGSARPGTPSP